MDASADAAPAAIRNGGGRLDSLGPTPEELRIIVRHCYMVITFNAIWLLIPLVGLITGNNIPHIFEALVVAGLVLFISNSYIGNRWYYNSDYARGTIYEKHFGIIDTIGLRTFFSTLVGSLTFLILAVFLSDALKAYAVFIVSALDIVLSALFVGLAIWVVTQTLRGLAQTATAAAAG